MANRRAFLTGLLASAVCPAPTWADAGDPAFLSAARMVDSSYALFGLDQAGTVQFQIPLPARGHAAAAHPNRPEAIAFARRPGTFAILLDCVLGQPKVLLDAPEGRHFYGHGVYSDDGRYLFTTENDYEQAEGRVGVWDVDQGYQRIAEFPSYGVGPHDIRLMPDNETLVIANGGIETHPDAPRVKLNLPVMQPNLSYVSLSGNLLEHHEPPAEWHKNSIRHLAVRGDGRVAIACQWQGVLEQTPPLLAIHQRGQPLQFHPGPEGLVRDMQGYAGSIAFSGDGTRIAITGPRGGMAVVFSDVGRHLNTVMSPDICGAAPRGAGFAFTTGLGEVLKLANGRDVQTLKTGAMQWDNHLVRL
ncbi:DUF1513 domain-containing protein [Roseovarius sp. 2305UL8-3]|uniref:DUF1513 domain-containing protein n=1 Tax=Roseovarius conchicola TaxID=3121636 RepID=UPI0035270046